MTATRGEAGPSRAPGWKAHAIVLAIGAFLALPILVLDLAFLGPSPGDVRLDFRGLAIGAYLVAWLSEALLATIFVALSRGRSVGLAIAAHFAAVLGVVLAAGLFVVYLDAREASYGEDMDREIARVRDGAREELRVVGWRLAPSSGPPRVLVTLEASMPGEVTILALESLALPQVGWRGGPVAIRAGRSTVEVESFEREVPRPRGDRMQVEWVAQGRDIPIFFEACRPLCSIHPDSPDELAIELPPIRTE